MLVESNEMSWFGYLVAVNKAKLSRVSGQESSISGYHQTITWSERKKNIQFYPTTTPLLVE